MKNSADKCCSSSCPTSSQRSANARHRSQLHGGAARRQQASTQPIEGAGVGLGVEVRQQQELLGGAGVTAQAPQHVDAPAAGASTGAVGSSRLIHQ